MIKSNTSPLTNNLLQDIRFCCEGPHSCNQSRENKHITPISPTTKPVSGLYLQNAFFLGPPAVASPMLLSGWYAGLGLLGSPSDSSRGPEGDNPRMLPLSSLREKAHVSLKFSILSLLTDKQGLSWGIIGTETRTCRLSRWPGPGHSYRSGWKLKEWLEFSEL